MKIVIFIFLLFKSAFALEHTCNAIVRVNGKKLKEKSVKIKDLKSKTAFDGIYLKITRATSKKAIRFDSELSLRACTAYYHASKARDYFIAKFNLKHLKKKRALVMRLEMSQAFEESVHFLPKRFGEVANNALTIPPSSNARLDEVDPWYYELWFAPVKEMNLNSALETAADIASSGPVLRNLIFGVAERDLGILFQDFIGGVRVGNANLRYYIATLSFSVGITALVPKVAGWISKLAKKKVYLDSGMIPEVIYHEYTHYALSPILDISHSSVLAESVANYYASRIADRESILGDSKPYVKGLVNIDTKGKRKYRYHYDDMRYAQADFGFKFFHRLKDELGGLNFDHLLVNSLKQVDTTEELSLKPNFLKAFFKTLKNTGDKKLIYRYHKVTQDLGI